MLSARQHKRTANCFDRTVDEMPHHPPEKSPISVPASGRINVDRGAVVVLMMDRGAVVSSPTSFTAAITALNFSATTPGSSHVSFCVSARLAFEPGNGVGVCRMILARREGSGKEEKMLMVVPVAG